jgi:hypothetical protein
VLLTPARPPENTMLAFRRMRSTTLALGLGASLMVGFGHEVAAQAKPHLLPPEAYQRLDSLERAASIGSTFAERLDAVTTITHIGLGQGNCWVGPPPTVIKYPGLVRRLAARLPRVAGQSATGRDPLAAPISSGMCRGGGVLGGSGYGGTTAESSPVRGCRELQRRRRRFAAVDRSRRPAAARARWGGRAAALARAGHRS